MPPPSLPLKPLFGIHWLLVKVASLLPRSPLPQWARYSVALWGWGLRGRKGQVKHKSFFLGDSLRPASKSNCTLSSSMFLSICLPAMETLLMLSRVPTPWAVQSFQPLFWRRPTLAICSWESFSLPGCPLEQVLKWFQISLFFLILCG